MISVAKMWRHDDISGRFPVEREGGPRGRILRYLQSSKEEHQDAATPHRGGCPERGKRRNTKRKRGISMLGGNMRLGRERMN